jgi:hypothetical protein
MSLGVAHQREDTQLEEQYMGLCAAFYADCWCDIVCNRRSDRWLKWTLQDLP